MSQSKLGTPKILHGLKPESGTIISDLFGANYHYDNYYGTNFWYRKRNKDIFGSTWGDSRRFNYGRNHCCIAKHTTVLPTLGDFCCQYLVVLMVALPAILPVHVQF